MFTKRAFWITLLMTCLVNVLLIHIVCVHAQFYFPFTSGLSPYYHYGTLRYGTLFGLSGMMPYGMEWGSWGVPYGWNIPGMMGFWGGFYGGIGPFGSYLWPY